MRLLEAAVLGVIVLAATCIDVSPAAALFVNGTFETGDFTGWTLEYGSYAGSGNVSGWTSVLPQGHPVPIIIDANTPPLPAQANFPIPIYEGTRMARINDDGGDSHATRVSQVDNLSSADLSKKFLQVQWGAVLEDHGAPPSAQPIFRIEVLANGVAVVDFVANTDDAMQTGSGWEGAGIGWWYRRGSFYTDLSSYAVGTPIEVRMMVTDCSQGGHGGYAFLDDVRMTPDTTVCTPPPSGLLSWWPLDELNSSTTGELVRQDNAIVRGTTVPVGGRVGGAMSFPTSASFLEAGSLPGVSTGDFTLDAWIQTTNTSTPVRTIIDKRGPDGRGFSLYISFGHLGIQLADGSFTNYTSSGPELWDGNWHLVAATVERGNPQGGRLYVDGQQVLMFDPTTHAGSLDNAGPLRIGQAFNGSSNAFLGSIDEVELFTRALGFGELDNIRRAAGSGKCRSAIEPIAAVVSRSDWFQDAFPHNADPALPGTARFDTTAALIKTGHNISSPALSGCRPDVAGDSLVVAVPGPNMRVDLVFRIDPGPGNYMTVGDRTSGLRRYPSLPVLAVAGDGSWWGTLLGDVGLFGTSGPNVAVKTMDAASPNVSGNTAWDPNVWCSVRMDTLESGAGSNNALVVPGFYQSSVHERDLGLPTPDIDPDNARRSAWGAREYVKILPDGMFTPGTHIQYFIRRAFVGNVVYYSLVPDTNRVTPQPEEGSVDAHRWQQFSVLPDRWKDPSWSGNPPSACMLVIDLDDGDGDEAAWVSAAEQMGATKPARFGSHNGWHAPTLTANPNDPAMFVRHHTGQAGTLWDLYSIHGSDDPVNGFAGSLGSRLGCSLGGTGAGRESRIGPTLEMLKAYYGLIVILSGERKDQLFGPVPIDGSIRSQNDVQMLTDFAQQGHLGPFGRPRGVYALGSGFAESEASAHAAFLDGVFGVSLVNGIYGASPACLDLGIVDFSLGCGLANSAELSSDVLALTTLSGAAVGAEYRVATGIPSGIAGSVYKTSTAGAPWTSRLDGWSIKALRSPLCYTVNTRAAYLSNVLNNSFDAVTCSSMLILDAEPRAPMAVDGLKLAGDWRAPSVEMTLTVTLPQRLSLVVYDIAGRRVRTLLDGPTKSGVHVLSWDRRDASGHTVRSGFYFVRARFENGLNVTNKAVLLR